MRFETGDLHFAAYVKAKGGSFEGMNGRRFIFTSDRSPEEWKVEHTNSCCRKVDKELFELKRFL